MELKRIKFLISAEAQSDIRHAESYCENMAAGPAVRFRLFLQRKFEQIADFPFAHVVWYKNIRFASLPVFPFVTHYIITEDERSAVVIAVHHEKESPERWMNFSV